MENVVTLAQAAARSGISERELRRAAASGQLEIAGRAGRSRLVTLDALREYQQARVAAPPRPRGRPPKMPGSVRAAEDLYRQQMQQFLAADSRRRMAQLVRAYREAEPTIAELEQWLAKPGALEGRIAFFEPLRRALHEGQMTWGIDAVPAEMRFVRIRRLAGWTWPAIAKELEKSERWAQILDRRWRETFGADNEQIGEKK